MTSGGISLTTALRRFASGWNEFFHAPQDTRVCALVRIAYALVLLVNLAVLYPDLALWFTDDGVLPLQVSREIGEPHQWSLLWPWPSTLAVVQVGYWLLVGHTFLLLVGLASRLNALAVLAWLISFQHRNPVILDGEDLVFRLLAFYLILMPCGRNWSVDAAVAAWWRKDRRQGSGVRRQETAADAVAHSTTHHSPLTAPAVSSSLSPVSSPLAPAFGLRLLQIQMAVIFFTAGLWKLGGEPWLNGTALYYVARMDDYFGRFPVPAILFDTPWIVALLTWAVVIAELAIPVLIWFRETRRLCLVAVVLFHLANEWTMHLFLFHWIMLVGWLAFVRPEEIRGLGLGARAREEDQEPESEHAPSFSSPSP
ncbi:MAG: HTTM domain-containing protein [Pirellulaceae bacterium]|nr:HTTM domain-containing protein [Pirellulaceae bacterium]